MAPGLEAEQAQEGAVEVDLVVAVDSEVEVVLELAAAVDLAAEWELVEGLVWVVVLDLVLDRVREVDSVVDLEEAAEEGLVVAVG